MAAMLSLTAALLCRAAVMSEDFFYDPFSRGWRCSGEKSLFAWNNTNQHLEVTWDSSRSNGFFYLPLQTIVAKSDNFAVSFDLRLRDIRLGASPTKTNTFEIAVGFLNSSTITNTNYFRGAGQSASHGVRNLVEFNYFPPAGFITATFATTVISTNNRIKPAHNFPLEMTTGDLFRIALTYTASNQTLRTSAIKNGAPFGMSPDNTLADLVLTTHPDFRLDAFGVSSYSDAIQADTPNNWGSVLAHGVIDNILLTVPGPPLDQIRIVTVDSPRTIEFNSLTNWNYTLQRSENGNTWKDGSQVKAGITGPLRIEDTNALSGHALYRVRAERP